MPHCQPLQTIDGLTIEGGGDITVSGNNLYKVILNVGNLTLETLTVTNGKCTSCSGGGITNTGSITILNSTVSNNKDYGIYNESTGTVTITDSTISGNSTPGYGGGVSNIGVLIVTNSILTGNSAPSSAGGGAIYSQGTLTITNSTFTNNTAGRGSIYNDGTATITNSTFSSNSATANGGGISNNGTVTVTNSTFSGNTATYGGGIFNSTGTATVTNSTFSGNSIIGGIGGGINNTGGTLSITNSTFSGNTTDVDYAGAIFSDGTLHLKNTILANSGFSGDCYNGGTIATDINNLIEVNGYVGNNLCGTPALTSDPQLGALADNGGPTQTHALLLSSPALGAGANTVCDDNPGPNNLDQRGVTRPQSGNCDIGAL